MGLLYKQDQRFELSETSRRHLVKRSPFYIGGVFEHLRNEIYPLWQHLDSAVCENSPQWSKLPGMNPAGPFESIYATEQGVRAFMDAAQANGLAIPGVFGVFYYRSANPQTLEMLSQFLPVPVEELKKEFAAGGTPVDVCARTIRMLHELGARHFYVSNLPTKKTAATLNSILDAAHVAS